MVDHLTPAKRSWNMARIRSAGTQPEQAVESILANLGYAFRTNVKDIPGTPDLVIQKTQTIIFVHGCFWHRHLNCRFASAPKTRVKYWTEKFARTMARDRRVARALRRSGWSVLVVWECQLRSPYKVAQRLQRLLAKRLVSCPGTG